MAALGATRYVSIRGRASYTFPWPNRGLSVEVQGTDGNLDAMSVRINGSDEYTLPELANTTFGKPPLLGALAFVAIQALPLLLILAALRWRAGSTERRALRMAAVAGHILLVLGLAVKSGLA